MRFSATACVAALSASSLVAAGSWFGSGADIVVQDADKVPGDSPLTFCRSAEERKEEVISIEQVDLLPNPPESGASLVIRATGTVYERIEEGAYVKLVVKYGLIRLISTTVDLCEQVENVDMKCPIEKGVLSITKAVEIPKEVPPGTYNVFADVYTDDDKPVTCLQATVTFGMKKTSDAIESGNEL